MNDVTNLEKIMAVVGQHLEENCPVSVVHESVVKHSRGFMCEQLSAVITIDDDPFIRLQQACDNLKYIIVNTIFHNQIISKDRAHLNLAQ